MSIEVYNTLSGEVEKFKPTEGKEVNMFVCGPTVYDYAHIGNAKTFTQFDCIVKYLRYRSYDVHYLQNITDIDDKIITRAKERGMSWKALADQYHTVFLEDMQALGNDAVTEYARATDYIPQIVRQVATLEEKGYAYRTKDGIYFEISKFPNYGKLSGRTEVVDTDGVSRIDADPEKRNPNDFCLWKFAREGDPYWETALGNGRPGWHIEDTAMAEEFFGPQYDIHGGAVDLIFPHHEAEIAQMEASSGKSPFVRYWLHAGFLNMQQEKMSKSSGNFVTIREALRVNDPRVLRFMFISGRYRSSMEYSEKVLEQSKQTLKRIDEFLFRVNDSYESELEIELVFQLQRDLVAALDNDFNTPQALSLIFDYVKARNIDGEVGKNAIAFFREINSFFGFFRFKENQSNEVEDIDALVKLRDSLRGEKRFKEADAIRQELERRSIKLYDHEGRTEWRRFTE